MIGIEPSPGICEGAACVAGTRIPVWVLEGCRRLGWTEERLLANYPTLEPADLVRAWVYVDANRHEIDEAIARNEAA